MAQTFVQTHVQMFCMCRNERKLIENLSMRGRTRRDWVCPTRVWSCIWQVISTGRKQYKRIDLANSPVGGRTARIIQCMAFMSLCTYVYICLGVWAPPKRRQKHHQPSRKKTFGKNSFPLICNEWRNEKWGGHSPLMVIRFIHLFIASS